MQQSLDQNSNITLVLLRRIWLPILGLILGGALAALVTQQITPMYQSSVYLLVAPTSRVDTSTTPNVQEQANDYAQAYGKLVADPAVTGSAVTESGVGVDPWDVRRITSVEVSPKAPVLQITTNSPSAQSASTLANALGNAVSSFTRARSSDTGYEAQLMAEAVPPVYPSLPNWRWNIAVGAATGLLVGGILALLWDNLRQARESWADQRRARRIEKDKQRRASHEEMERQRQEREAAELEKTLEQYLKLRSNDLQKSRQGDGGRYETGNSSPLSKMSDEAQKRG
ncbi:MAG: hypothetical protein JOZ19_09610 [Rubrobacter sp.]|nr:hypothetical protein [Rubrobacter sp.]